MTLKQIQVDEGFDYDRFDFISAMSKFGATINSYDVVLIHKDYFDSALGDFYSSFKVLKSHYFPVKTSGEHLMTRAEFVKEAQRKFMRRSLVNFTDFYNIEVLFV